MVEVNVSIEVVFPHQANSYCVLNNYFSKGDTVTDGEQDYLILKQPSMWVERETFTGPGYWVYELDKPVPNPTGKKLYYKNK